MKDRYGTKLRRTSVIAFALLKVSTDFRMGNYIPWTMDGMMRGVSRAAALFIIAALPANAADKSILYGKWIEHFSNGAVFAYVFAPRLLGTFVELKNGGEAPASKPQRVSYTDLGANKIRVDYVPFGGWFIVKVENHNAIRVIRLGEGVYSFLRFKNPQ
jgi:hypothetical protein